MNSLCVFCGSYPGKDDDYLEAARSLGRLLAGRGITLVYGGGSAGLMGAIANATLRAGGRAVGVIPRHLWDKEMGHRALSDLHIVETIRERMAKMTEMADAFLVLPGGIGTVKELFELWNWGQLGVHDKPFGILDVKGYWTGLFDFLDTMAEAGFLKAEQRAMVQYATTAEELLAKLGTAVQPVMEKWLDLALT